MCNLDKNLLKVGGGGEGVRFGRTFFREQPFSLISFNFNRIYVKAFQLFHFVDYFLYLPCE